MVLVAPKQVYEVEYKDMGDWLGTERTRYHRPFVEARAFTRTLGLRGYKQWLAYCRSGKKPADIPSDPGRAYRSEYEGIDDWLGAKYRPFAEARTFVNSLHLKNFDEWEAYRKSREKPVDIPSNPNKVYSAEYRGLRDWLGVVDKWDSRTLLTRLYELRPQLSTLDRRELYELLEQEGSFSLFRRALGPRTTPAQVLRELKDNNGSKLEQTLRNALDREAETSSVEFVKKEALAANGARAVDVFEQKNDSAFPAETQLTKLGETLNTDVSLASSFLYSQDVRAEASIPRREEGEVTRIAQSTRTIEVFFCYAHEDRTWREELERHLSVLKRSGQIAMWHDRLIRPGAEWEREIDAHLNSTEIILLLVSPYFIASDYCWGVEMNRALEMHERGQAYVIPIIIRPVYWEEAPFAKLQVLPTGGKPITKWSDTHEAFLDVARGIHEVVKALRVRPQ